ncbi:hypothetical protein QU24_05875 [Pantoea rodasii]|uniref:Uncharacterized protein n=1 Tax=Pantoea rodasii TaxID=1076549 RepID=A0A0B1R8W4_9GAMM|nr:hypothetical protein QU24_05875 [Pantoea rodasii]
MLDSSALMITPSGAALGLAVLTPLKRYLHFTRLPYGPVPMEHPCSSATFRPRPAGSPGILILFSAAECQPQGGTSLLLSFSACCSFGSSTHLQ